MKAVVYRNQTNSDDATTKMKSHKISGGHLGIALILVFAVSSTLAQADVVNGQIRLLRPASVNTTVDDARELEIDVGAYRGPVIMLFDNADVTALVRRDGSRLLFRQDGTLAPGMHRLQVWATDPAGPGRANWNLVLSQAVPAGGQREIYSHSSLSLSASRIVGDKVQNIAWTANGNLALNAGARAEQVEATLQGNIAYSSTATPDKTTLSNYLLTIKHEDDSLALGDVNFRGTPLTASSLARRGMLATVNSAGTNVQLLEASTDNVSGWNSGLLSQNRIYGLAVAGTLHAGEQPLRISSAILSGENGVPQSANVSTTEPPSSGRVAGIQGNGRAFDTGFAAEAGWSSYDRDTTDTAAAMRDRAVTFQLDKALGGIAWTLNYLFAGPEFSSIANPRALRDRQQYGLGAGTAFGVSSLSATVSRSRDNVNSNPVNPVVYNNAAGVTWAIAPAEWPVLSLSWQNSKMNSTAEPAGVPHAENNSRTVSGNASYGRPGWSGNLALSRSAIDDPAQGKSASTSEQLSFNFQPSQDWNLSPTLSHTGSDHAAVKQNNRLVTVAGNWRLYPAHSLSGQLSQARNESSGNLTDNEQQTAILRYAWDVTPSLPRVLLGNQASLTLSVSRNRLQDNIVAARNQNTNSIFLGIDVTAPLDGRIGF